MYPSQWAGDTIERLSHQHPVVWVEDPYCLVAPEGIESLRNRLVLLSRPVIAARSGFDLRRELLAHEPRTARLVVIDQSYKLHDPHKLPKDAKPCDLVPLPAPDWKPFLEDRALFRPTVLGFLTAVTDDPRWPVEVNIYPYEELARDDPDGFVRAYDSFRRAGKPLTSEDLSLIGASAVFKVDLVDLSDPFRALEVAFHSDEKWQRLTQFFNAVEIDQIRSRLRVQPPPVGDLFGPDGQTARLALAALLVLRQHADEPGFHLAVLSQPLARYADCAVAAAPEAPGWFLETEVPLFEQLLTPKFATYLHAALELDSQENARNFWARERCSDKLRSLVLAHGDVRLADRGPRSAEDFALSRLVPDFRKARQDLHEVVQAAKGHIERFRLTTLKLQTARMALDTFDTAGTHRIDALSGRLDRLIRDIEGPARREWASTPGFEQRWTEERRECRNLMAQAACFQEDVDYLFGRLLEARYAEIVPQEVPTTRLFYERFMLPRRKGAAGETRPAVVLMIDSMRFDLWRNLVRPALERDYQVQEVIGLSELPSETKFSRVSFFAGRAPGELPRSVAESALFAELISRLHGSQVSFAEVPERRTGLRFAVRSSDGSTLAAVFDFADALAHHVDWDPYTVHEALRPLVREIRALLASQGPEVPVFITADHGHYLHAGGAPVYLENAPDVGYRSAYVTQRVEGRDGQHVFQIPAAALGHGLPGLFVFPKPRFYLRSRDAGHGAGRPGAGYRHGGLSLSEMAIPLAYLVNRRAPTKILIAARFRGKVTAGESAEIEVSATADSGIQSPVRLSADTADVEPVMAHGISSTETIHKLRFTPLSPGRRRIRISAQLGDQEVDAKEIEVEVGSAPVPEDEAKVKLRKLFGED